MTGNLNRDDYPKSIQEFISNSRLENLHDFVLKPYLKGITNDANRSSQEVFTKSELADMLSNKDGLVDPDEHTPVGTSIGKENAGGGFDEHFFYTKSWDDFYRNLNLDTNVPDQTKKVDKTVDVGRFGKYVDFLKKHKTAIGLSAVGAMAITAAIAIARHKRKNKGKKKNGGTEKRAYIGESIVDTITNPISTVLTQSSRRHPLGAIVYDAVTAEDPEDYRMVNERLANWFNTHQGTGDYIPYTFDSPSWRPGDIVSPIGLDCESGEYSPSLRAQMALNVFNEPIYEKTKNGGYVYKGRPNLRYAPLLELAAGLLPSQNYIFRGDVKKYPIGMRNLANMFPFAIGQYAEDSGMKNDDIARLYKVDGDELTSRAIIQQINKYPLLRNCLSAYVNGGFGRTDDPKSFGLADGWWDYAANAPTPAGTNAIDNVVNDIVYNRLDGNYERGKHARRVIRRSVRDQLRGAMLQTADTIGPRVLKPNTYLGNELLTHPDAGVYGTIDKVIPIAKEYYDKDTNIVHRMMGTLPPETKARLKELKEKGENFAKQVEQKSNDVVSE